MRKGLPGFLFVALSFAWDNEKTLHINISRGNLIPIVQGCLIWNYAKGVSEVRLCFPERLEQEPNREGFRNFIDGVHMADTFSTTAAGEGWVNKLDQEKEWE